MKLTFDDIKKLQQKKYRAEFGCFLVEGEHLILELHKALAGNPALSASRLYVTDDYADFDSPLEKTLLNERQMKQISDTKNPQGIAAVVPFLPSPETRDERCIYLHEIQDPGNLGTILRTLAWFGGFRCLLSPNSVDPYNPKVVRASMGAIFHTPIELDVSAEQLASRFQQIAYLDMQGAPLTDTGFKTFDCYLFGNEARGVPAELLAQFDASAFSIAGSGQIESLNLASAVNMAVYELQR